MTMEYACAFKAPFQDGGEDTLHLPVFVRYIGWKKLQLCFVFNVYAYLRLMFVACAFASVYNARINQDSMFCIPTKPFLCIILTLLICWAFLCVAVFCLNATRTDLWRVRVLLSRAQPFGPPLSENTTIWYKTWACRSATVKNQLHHVLFAKEP